VPIVEDTGWAPEPSWALWRIGKSPSPPGIRDPIGLYIIVAVPSVLSKFPRSRLTKLCGRVTMSTAMAFENTEAVFMTVSWYLTCGQATRKLIHLQRLEDSSECMASPHSGKQKCCGVAGLTLPKTMSRKHVNNKT
jgi:hypothetical protein